MNGPGNTERPVNSSDPDWEKVWPQLGSTSVNDNVKKGLKITPVPLRDQSGYTMVTAGGKQRVKKQIEKEIRQQLFASSTKTELEELDNAWRHLESSMGRMSNVQWGSAKSDQMTPGAKELEKQGNGFDVRFDHSWVPSGPEPGPGWFWIPKGNLVMDSYYPAHKHEVRRYRYLARQVRRLPPPAPLSHSFSSIVETGMANRDFRPPKRRQEDWRNEGWMEEDDLLQEDFRYEQDLRRQLMRDSRNPGDKGRRQEGTYSRALIPSNLNQDRVSSGKILVGGRGESHHGQGQQGGRFQIQRPPWSGSTRGQIPDSKTGNQNTGTRVGGKGGEIHVDQRAGQGVGKDGDLERGNNKGNRAPNQDIKCFRCLGSGHFQVDCTNDPVC
jgi:hypothetical protein